MAKVESDSILVEQADDTTLRIVIGDGVWRDLFAAASLAGTNSHLLMGVVPVTSSTLARWAYEEADAMLRERAKREEK